MGGLFTPSVHEEKGRIAFSAFVKGGWDVYVSDDLNTMLQRNYPTRTSRCSRMSRREPAAFVGRFDRVRAGYLLALQQPRRRMPIPRRALAPATSTLDTYQPKIHPMGDVPAELAQSNRPGEATHVGVRPPGEKRQRRARVSRRHGAQVPDEARPGLHRRGGGVAFTSGFGFSIANSIALSDMMGDQHLMFAFSLYQDIASRISWRRTLPQAARDFSFGAYQFSSFFNDRVTSVGRRVQRQPSLQRAQLRHLCAHESPFQQVLPDGDQPAGVLLGPHVLRRHQYAKSLHPGDSQSNVRLDRAVARVRARLGVFRSVRPVEGNRWRISLARGVAFENRDVSRTTGYLDWRAYNTIFWRNSIALRLTGAASVGEDRRVFYLGGPYTLRGYDWQQFIGTKMWLASFEYRFPLLDYLIFGWPGRWGFSNIGANVFFDIGNTWVDRWPKIIDTNSSHFQLDDAKADVGFGVFMDLGYFLMNLQFAWPTDLYRFDHDMKFHFAIGPTF
jgi:hypothetical protein